MLLERDGLSKTWERGTPSEWEGGLGEHSIDDIPFELHALGSSPRELIEFDCTRLGRHVVGNDGHDGNDGNDENDQDREDDDNDDDNDDGMDYETEELSRATYVRKLTLDTFKKRLINHFSICVDLGVVYWPTRLCDKPYSAIARTPA
jgi:hypothetical protein